MQSSSPSDPGKEVAPPGSNIDTSGPENITVNELDKAFEELETHTVIDPSLVNGSKCWKERFMIQRRMKKVDEVAPTGF